MHRHGYQGRKFHRERAQRQALLKGLTESLIKHESIETTLPKAKEIVPYIEKLITKAKKGDLHNRRQVVAGLQTVENAHKLVDEIAPKLKGRDSGHVRIERTRVRRGDNAELARVSFVEFAPGAQAAEAAESGVKSQELSGKAADSKKAPAKKAEVKK